MEKFDDIMKGQDRRKMMEKMTDEELARFHNEQWKAIQKGRATDVTHKSFMDADAEMSRRRTSAKSASKTLTR